MRASEWAGDVEKARAPLRTRGTERAANIVMVDDCAQEMQPPKLSVEALQAWKTRRDAWHQSTPTAMTYA